MEEETQLSLLYSPGPILSRRGQTWMGGYIFFCLAPQCLTCLWRPALEEGAQVFQSANPGRDQPCGAQPGKDTGAATLAWLPMACLAHGGQPWMRGIQLPWPHSPGPNKPWGSCGRRGTAFMARQVLGKARLGRVGTGQPWKKVAPVPWPGFPVLEWPAEETSGREGTASPD